MARNRHARWIRHRRLRCQGPHTQALLACHSLRFQSHQPVLGCTVSVPRVLLHIPAMFRESTGSSDTKTADTVCTIDTFFRGNELERSGSKQSDANPPSTSAPPNIKNHAVRRLLRLATCTRVSTTHVADSSAPLRSLRNQTPCPERGCGSGLL